MADRYSKYISTDLMTAKYISIDILSFWLKRLTIQDSEINSSVSCVKSISLKKFTNTLNYMTTGSGMGTLLASKHSSFLCYLDFVSQPVFKIHTQCLLSYTRFSPSQINISNRYWQDTTHSFHDVHGFKSWIRDYIERQHCVGRNDARIPAVGMKLTCNIQRSR